MEEGEVKQWHVTYYYLATGMEGRPDVEDYGVIAADNAAEAKEKAARRRHPKMSQRDLDWCIGCLSAKEVR